eukprot:scaffold20758_cov28-Tisochrysis_lutea.AAC.1
MERAPTPSSLAVMAGTSSHSKREELASLTKYPDTPTLRPQDRRIAGSPTCGNGSSGSSSRWSGGACDAAPPPPSRVEVVPNTSKWRRQTT